MEVQLKIQEWLQKKETEGKNRVRSGKFNPSNLGSCYRKQYWDRLNVDKSNPPDEQGLKNFEMGHIMHAWVQSLYPKSEIEVGVWTDHFAGFADIVLEDEVIDVKYVKSYAWKFLKQRIGRNKLKKDDGDESYENYLLRMSLDKIHNVMQVCFYGKELGKKIGRVCYINEKLETIELVYKVKEWEELINKEVDRLVDIWVGQQLPAAVPRLFKGKECSYCSFYDKCQGLLPLNKNKGEFQWQKRF